MIGSPTSRIFDHFGAPGARVRRFASEIKAGLGSMYRPHLDEPWRSHRPTYEEWQDYIAPLPREPRARG